MEFKQGNLYKTIEQYVSTQYFYVNKNMTGNNILLMEQFKEMELIFDDINHICENLDSSDYLLSRFLKLSITYYYSNLILNIVNNIKESPDWNEQQKQAYLKEFNTTIELAEQIFKENLALSSDIDETRYIEFKNKTILKFPQIRESLEEIEDKFNAKRFPKFIKSKQREMKFIDKSKSNINSQFHTLITEDHLKQNKPITFSEADLSPEYVIKIIKKLVDIRYEEHRLKHINPLINKTRDAERDFNNRLIDRWIKPFESFEELLELSLFCINNCRMKWNNEWNTYKTKNLIGIHARSLRISREIFTLLRSGYSDGANARWRSLHELEVIASFLYNSEEMVSERYHYFQDVINHEKLKNYNEYVDRLNEQPFTETEILQMEEQFKEIEKRYDNFYYQGGWGWIPSDSKIKLGLTAKQRISLHDLEKAVGLDHMSPYYKWASDSIHGNSSGFYPLGMGEDFVLLIGPTNIGLTNPLHQSALSLWRITGNLLLLDPSIENSFYFYSMEYLVEKIGTSAIQVQQSIDQDEIWMKNRSINSDDRLHASDK